MISSHMKEVLLRVNSEFQNWAGIHYIYTLNIILSEFSGDLDS